MSTSEAREAEFRAKIRAGQMESVGRVILFSDIPHPDDNGRYWKVYPAPLREVEAMTMMARRRRRAESQR